MKPAIFTFLLLPLMLGCQEKVKTDDVLKTPTVSIAAQSSLGSCKLSNGDLRVVVDHTDKGIAITLSGASVASNISLIEVPSDECMAEGFESLTCQQDSFTINQQLCSGWNIISETLTFGRSSDDTKDYQLLDYKRKSMDRRDPEKEKIKIFKHTQFGQISFEKLDRDRLIELINN